MGVHLELAPHLYRLMSPEDQERFGINPSLWQSSAPDPKLDPHPPVKSGGSEKEQQKSFANWLTEKNQKGAKIPWFWHAMHKATKATPGTPDFWVGINSRSVFFEFKRDYSCELTPPQETFRLYCEAQNIEHYVVYSAFAAIKIVEDADALTF